MQCRPGDIAMVVNDFEYPENNGALLRIDRTALPGQFEIPADWVGEPLSTFRFGTCVIAPGKGIVVYRDSELKPLRDDKGDDQTIAWAGHPTSLLRAQPPQKKEVAPIEAHATVWELVDDSPPPSPYLRAEVRRVERFRSGDWGLYVICGDIAFDFTASNSVMQPGGVKPGDSIRIEYKKGCNPLAGPYTKVCLMNEPYTRSIRTVQRVPRL